MLLSRHVSRGGHRSCWAYGLCVDTTLALRLSSTPVLFKDVKKWCKPTNTLSSNKKRPQHWVILSGLGIQQETSHELDIEKTYEARGKRWGNVNVGG